jgi:hypothetical protein
LASQFGGVGHELGIILSPMFDAGYTWTGFGSTFENSYSAVSDTFKSPVPEPSTLALLATALLAGAAWGFPLRRNKCCITR